MTIFWFWFLIFPTASVFGHCWPTTLGIWRMRLLQRTILFITLCNFDVVFFCSTEVQDKPLTKRLINRQIGLNNEHGSSSNWAFLKNMPSSPVQHSINASNSSLRTLQKNMEINIKVPKSNTMSGVTPGFIHLWASIGRCLHFVPTKCLKVIYT